MAQVFISYASENRDVAEKILRALSLRDVTSWFAPEDVRPGDRFSEKIVQAISQCRLFLLLWSKHALQSPHVAEEIALAINDPGILKVPVHLDDTPRYKYLASVNWARFSDLQVEGLANAINEHLRVADAPYPLGRLYKQIQNVSAGALQLPQHLEALRLLVRFVALVHVARYIRIRERSMEVNRQVESLFTRNSLFADLDVARVVMRWLDDHNASVDDRFRHVFRVDGTVPGIRQVEVSEDAADTFDTKNLHLLLDSRDDLRPDSNVRPEQAKENLCYGVRDFLRTALSLGWPCRLILSAPRGGGDGTAIEIEGPLELSHEEAAAAKLSLMLPSGRLDLDRFLTLVPAPRTGYWEVGFLRSQNGMARFTAITSEPVATVELPPVMLPWGNVEIIRSLPKLVYIGETHRAAIELTNHSLSAVTIPRIEEKLPENLTSESGTATVEVATDLLLGRGETRVLEYMVRGTGVSGARRSFGDSAVTFSFEGSWSSANINGDTEILVQSVPPPHLIVTRSLVDKRNAPVTARVPLDSDVVVNVRIESGGGALENVRLEEEIEGAILVSGVPVVHSGPVDRLDRQNPILASYTIRVNGSGRLNIVMRDALGGADLGIQGADIQLDIDEMPPPRIELRWSSVARRGSSDLDAHLVIENTGGTCAYDLRIRHSGPGNTDVDVDWPTGSERLEPGGIWVVPVRIACHGVPSGSVHFELSHRSVSGAAFEGGLALDLDRVIAADLSALPVFGRQEVRERIRGVLTGSGEIVFNVYGESGNGKRLMITSEIDRLIQEGRQVALYQQDCHIAGSFNEAVALLLERIVFEGVTEEERGSASAFTSFLRRAGLDEQQYRGYITPLEAMLYRSAAPSDGTWRALTFLLARLARSRKLDRLVLLLHGVSRYAKAELEGLRLMRQYLQPPTDIRIVVTAYGPLKSVGDTDIEVGRLSPDDCREMVGRVFIMPQASEGLQQALWDKSEGIPANLISILKGLIERPDHLLDFSSPAGVRLRNQADFWNLPTSLVESERKTAEMSDVPPAVLACLAAIREPFDEERIGRLLAELDEDSSGLHSAVVECEKLRWLVPAGRKFEVASATVRKALASAAPAGLLERVHQGLFNLLSREGRSPEVCFTHLAEAPVAFIASRGTGLIDGLRAFVAAGRFSQVDAILSRLRNAGLQLETPGNLELELIHQDLQWAETSDLDGAVVEKLLKDVNSIPNRPRESALKVRLCTLVSEWYSLRKEDHVTAASVAESAQRRWPFRRLPVSDPALEFDFYLNLWAIYYRLLDESGFRRIDQWIWKRLSTKRDGQYDSYAIARFLGQFLDFQRKFSTAAERYEYFPVRWTTTMGEKRPLRDNQIELLTRAERLRGSFLDEFLASPDKLNQNNVLVLGRLYVDVGTALLRQARTAAVPANRSDGESGGEDARAEDYLKRAEELFAAGGFLFDLARTRAGLGEMFVDRVNAVKKGRNKEELIETCSYAARWLQLAADDFQIIDLLQHAAGPLESRAEIMRLWTAVQPDRLMDGISAYERLIGLPEPLLLPDKRDGFRLILVQLYDQAGMFEPAARVLDQMTMQVAEVIQRRAFMHAKALLQGSRQVTIHNVRDFTGDLETLRSAPAVAANIPDQARGQLTSPAEAAGVIAWHLGNFYVGQQEGGAALQVLRASRREIAGAQCLTGILRERLPVMLPELWQMEGSLDAQMTQDFSTLLLPVMTSELGGAVEQMLEQVWKWEASRDNRRHLAAADMTLVLAGWRIDHGNDAAGAGSIAGQIFERVRSRNDWEDRSVASMLARALAMMLRAGAPTRDDGAIAGELADLLDALGAESLHVVALRVLLYLVEILLELHSASGNAWYFEIVKSLAARFRALHALAQENFEEAMQLINVYLQLPGGIADAADLMEKQCQRLLEDKNYELLPQYLSFLSDLLGQAARDNKSAGQPGPEGAEAENSAAVPGRTEVLKTIATQLCGRIVAAIRAAPIDRRAERDVLFHAAKLLSGRETAGLPAAIYVKLFDMAREVDGASVWGFFVGASADKKTGAGFSLEDALALTTYSNCPNEQADGRFLGNPRNPVDCRNYLITCQTRNFIAAKLAATHPENRGLGIAYLGLEARKLFFLDEFIADIHNVLSPLNEFARLQLVTFLDDYIAPGAEAVPFGQKVQRIEKHRGVVKTEIQRAEEGVGQLRRLGFLPGQSEQVVKAVYSRAEQLIVANRRIGKEIMNALVERMQPFSLSDILGEVFRQLTAGRRCIEFAALLGLRARDVETGSSPGEAAAPEPFLNRDAASLIQPLDRSARQLLEEGEPALSERLYRLAARLCETVTAAPALDLLVVLRGLTQSLIHQGKVEEARDSALREVSVREANSDPELGSALEDLARVMENSGNIEEAEMFRRRKSDFDRDRPAAGNAASAVGHTASSEENSGV